MRPWNPNIRVQPGLFDIGEEQRRLAEGRADVGAWWRSPDIAATRAARSRRLSLNIIRAWRKAR
jgi:hypothetical protein